MPRSPHYTLAFSGAMFLFSHLLSAQSGVTLTSTGYSNPALLNVAPGQVTTLYLSGATTLLPATLPFSSAGQSATQLPLPTSLAGFSAQITEQPGNYSAALPIFSVEQDNRCLDSATFSADCIVTGITVQIPFDLYVDVSHTRPVGHVTAITVSQGGITSSSFYVNLVAQNVHILTTCDSGVAAGSGFFGACQNLITHVNGTLVSASSPAQSGEVLVMYAYGLGVPAGSTVVAGSASPGGANATQAAYSLIFAYRGSGTASSQGQTLAVLSPLFAGLTPGQVGLYQINFTVAAPNGAIIDCNNQDGANLLVTVMSGNSPSTDTARVCVSNGN